MRQFPFSAQQPGISYVALYPVSWNEPTIFEQRFRLAFCPTKLCRSRPIYCTRITRICSKRIGICGLSQRRLSSGLLQASQVKFLVHGLEFDDGVFEQEGHIQIDFGIDTPFLQEQVKLTAEAEAKVRANVQKLVEFTGAVEKNSGASARLLWSESEENLAQKLIARLQKVQ